MERIRQSLQGIDFRGIAANVINFVTGEGNGDTYSSDEEVSCNSDCSLCRSDAISLHLSSDSNSIKEERNGLKCHHPKLKRIRSNQSQSLEDEVFINLEKRTSEPVNTVKSEELKVQRYSGGNLSRMRVMNNPIFVTSKKRKIDEISCEEQKKGDNLLNQGSKEKRNSAQTHQDQLSHKSLLQEDNSDKSTSDLQDIDKSLKQIRIYQQNKQELLDSQNLLSTQVMSVNQPKPNQSITLFDLQSSSMMRHKIQELLSDFHKITLYTKEDSDIIKKKEEEINEQYVNTIEAVLMNENIDKDQIVINNKEANYTITKGSLDRIKPGQWFNDELINGYVSLLNLDKKEKEASSFYIFDTFFYTLIQNLRPEDLTQKVERILKRKKLNPQSFTKLIFPINIEKYHWFLAVLDLTKKKVFIIDSMLPNLVFSQRIKDVLLAAFKHYLNDDTEFETEVVEGVPKQMNGNDCGLCACLNIERLCRNGGDPLKIQYPMDNDHSKNYRKRLAVGLMFGKIIEE